MLVALVSFFVLSALSLPSNTGHGGHPTVTIDSGALQGISTSVPGTAREVNKFLGVPFAAPPVRFSPPQPPESWETPYDATKYGPACVQQFSYPELTRAATIQWFNTPPPPAGESEDCLNLNVYVPQTPGKKAVMAWIYGVSLLGNYIMLY